MKISSIDFLTQIDVFTNNVQNMVTSHKYTKLVQLQRCFPLPTKFIFTLTQLLYVGLLTEYYKKWTLLIT